MRMSQFTWRAAKVPCFPSLQRDIIILHNLPATGLLSNNATNSAFFVKSKVRAIGLCLHNRYALKCLLPASHPLLEPPPSANPPASHQASKAHAIIQPGIASQPPSLPDTTPQGPRLPRIFVRPRGRMTKMSKWLSLAPWGSPPSTHPPGTLARVYYASTDLYDAFEIS